MLERRGGFFFIFIGLKSPIPLFHLLISKFFPLIKWFIPPDLSFDFDFPLFSYIFNVDLLRGVVIC